MNGIPEAVIVDFDDTLAHTSSTRKPLFAAVLRQMGHCENEAELAAVWGLPFRAMLKRLAPAADFDSFLSVYIDLMSKHPPVATPGAQAFLANTTEVGATVHVFSSSTTELVQADLDALNLSQYVADIWCSDRVRYFKPDPRSLDGLCAALLKIGIERSQVAYVGDSAADYLVASGSGVDFFGVLTGGTALKDLLAAGAPAERIFPTLCEVRQELFLGPSPLHSIR